jgi:hypothetical protein
VCVLTCLTSTQLCRLNMFRGIVRLRGVVWRRSFSAAAKELAVISEEAGAAGIAEPAIMTEGALPGAVPSAAKAKAKGGLLDRLVAFATGLGVASAACYYQLRKDVTVSTDLIQKDVKALRVDVVDEVAALKAEVATLKREVESMR